MQIISSKMFCTVQLSSMWSILGFLYCINLLYKNNKVIFLTNCKQTLENWLLYPVICKMYTMNCQWCSYRGFTGVWGVFLRHHSPNPLEGLSNGIFPWNIIDSPKCTLEFIIWFSKFLPHYKYHHDHYNHKAGKIVRH